MIFPRICFGVYGLFGVATILPNIMMSASQRNHAMLASKIMTTGSAVIISSGVVGIVIGATTLSLGIASVGFGLQFIPLLTVFA
jgi:hypothetical protein